MPGLSTHARVRTSAPQRGLQHFTASKPFSEFSGSLCNRFLLLHQRERCAQGVLWQDGGSNADDHGENETSCSSNVTTPDYDDEVGLMFQAISMYSARIVWSLANFL